MIKEIKKKINKDDLKIIEEFAKDYADGKIIDFILIKKNQDGLSVATSNLGNAQYEFVGYMMAIISKLGSNGWDT